MEIIKMILSFFVKKITGSSTLLNTGDSDTNTKNLSDISINKNSGNVSISGRDINNKN